MTEIEDLWERLKEKAIENKNLVIEVDERGLIVGEKQFWVKQRAGDLNYEKNEKKQ